MKSINFSTGVKEYAINDDENNKIRININDLNIPNRTKEVQDFFEAMAENIKMKIDRLQQKKWLI